MSGELKITQIEKAEKKLREKGCKKKIGDLWDVPLDVLEIDRRFDFRRSQNSKKLKSMAQDILEKGILNPPIAIYSIDSDEIALAVGFRRVKSFKRNKKDYVPCRIFISKKVIAEEIFQLIVSDNIHREDMKPLELALFYHSWIKETGLKQKELAERIHRSDTYISDVLRPLEKLSDEEIDKILTSELTRSQLLEISKIDDKKIRIELIRKEESVRKIRELIVKQKDNKKLKLPNPKTFELPNEITQTSLGEAKIHLRIEFPTDEWRHENVLEILNHLIYSIKKFSEKRNYQTSFPLFDLFKAVKK